MKDIINTSDLELITGIRDGDTGAFRALVDRHHRHVYHVAWQVTGNDDDARDVTQEVFLRLHTSLDMFDRLQTFTTWLYRVTINAAIDFRRKRKNWEVPIDLLETEPCVTGSDARPDRTSEQSEFRVILEQIVGDLTDRQRAVFVLRDLQECTVAEIADILGCRPATVRVHLAAAREHIRGILLKKYPEYTVTYGTQENRL